MGVDRRRDGVSDSSRRDVGNASRTSSLESEENGYDERINDCDVALERRWAAGAARRRPPSGVRAKAERSRRRHAPDAATVAAHWRRTRDSRRITNNAVDEQCRQHVRRRRRCESAARTLRTLRRPELTSASEQRRRDGANSDQCTANGQADVQSLASGRGERRRTTARSGRRQCRGRTSSAARLPR